ncbi:helix-turn-helix domain-containing protein [Caulobacter segnis]
MRTAAQAAADKHDYLYLGLNRSPRPIWVRHCGRDSVINAGEMLIWSNTAAFERREQDRVCGHMVGFDRAKLAALAPEIEDLLARPIAVNTPALRHLQSYTDFLLRNGETTLPPLMGVSIGAMLTDLAVLGLGGKGDAADAAAGRGLRAKRLTDVLLAIDRGFAQPGFSSALLARSLGLSRRYVNELLAQTGQSLDQRVNRLRLARAMALLTSAEGDALRVTDIAAASGFNDLSYFNRQFRKAYGLSPTQARGR